VNHYIKEGVKGITFKHNLSHKDSCYEIATSDIGICWRKNGWGDNGEVSTKVKEYELYGLLLIDNIYDIFSLDTVYFLYGSKFSNPKKKLSYITNNININNLIPFKCKKIEHVIDINIKTIINKSDSEILDNYNGTFKLQIKEVLNKYGNGLQKRIINNHQYGHIDSFINIIHNAKEKNLSELIIFEDDVLFHNNVKKQLLNFNNIKKNADIIYFGASKHKDYFVDNSQYKCKNITGTFAIFFKNNVFDDYLELLNLNLLPSDICLLILQEKYKTYVYEPNLIISDLNNSSIIHRNDTNQLYKQFNWNLNNYISYDGIEYILIVLPTFNRSENIENIINMINKQTYKYYYLLIIDDGSNDNHKKTLNNIKHKYKENKNIIFKENEKNLNIASTLNKGLQFLKDDKTVKYSFFTWISDDNIYHDNFLEKLIKNNNYFKYSSFNLVNKINNVTKKINIEYNIENLITGFKGCSSFMWTKEAILKTGLYNTNINGCEDWEYLIRTFKTDRFQYGYEDDSLMDYIRHTDSLYVKENDNINKLKKNIVKIWNFLNNDKTNIVYYSKTNYKILFQRPQQIMRFLDKTFNKVFIGNIENVEVDEKYGLLIVPYHIKDCVFNFINNNDKYLYFTDSRLYNEITDKSEYKKIYDLIDAPIDEFEVWKPNLEKCVKNSDCVMYSHPDLIQFLNEIDANKKYHYISNACDYEHFSKARERIGARPVDFPSTDKPILGYYGAFAQWLDFDIIRKHADEGLYHIVMIGGIVTSANYNLRFDHPNITWLAHKSYDELPYYLSWFDKCFLPFKDCELTKYVNPCKLWEYMASEKEIIKYNVNMNVDKIVTYDDVCNKIVKIIHCNLSVIILCFNQLEYTKQCIESVLQNTVCDSYEVVVVNNASSDGTNEYLKELSYNNANVKVINNAENLGFSKGMNIGVRNSVGEYIILLNNDTIVSKDWDYSLIDLLEKDHDVFAVTPITNSSGNESMVSFEHTTPGDYFLKYTVNIKENINTAFEIKSLALFCGCFRANDFKNIGLLDENYLNGWEDDDLYERINILNKKVIVSTQSCVYHFGNITVGNNNYLSNTNKNRLLFESKWNKNWVTHYSSHNLLSEYYAVLNSKTNNTIFSKTIYIICTKYVLDIANNLQSLFLQFGIISEVYEYILINDEFIIPTSLNDENLFILLTPIFLRNFPKYSVMFQMEQFSGQFVTKEYIQYMNNCIYVIDYSRTNVKYFIENCLIQSNKISFQQLNFNINEQYSSNVYDYDILFIGGVVGSERRTRILKRLTEYCKIHNIRFYIINNDNLKFGEEKLEIIKKSKIIINIHYNPSNFQLETPRILEMISLNKIIISERSCMYDIEPTTYDNSVIFIDIINDDNSNFHVLTDTIHYFNDEKNFNYFNELFKTKNRMLCDSINRNSVYNLKKNIFSILNSTSSHLNNYVNASGNIALLTVNTNNYDDIKINSSKFDWYYFTDISTIAANKDKGLNYIFIDINTLIDYGINIHELSHIHPSTISKLIKTKGLTSKIFKSYQYVIWIDASIQIQPNFDLKVQKLISYNYDLYLFRHYAHENIFEEYKVASTLLKYYNLNNHIYDAMVNYTTNGTANGLYETGFIIYKNSPDVHKLTKDWFNEINKYGNECQLSFPTAINNNNNLRVFNLNTLESVKKNIWSSVWKNDMFIVNDHINSSYPRYQIKNKINYIDKMLWINLDRSKDRFNTMTKLLSNIDIPTERVSAVDGQRLHQYSYSINMDNNIMTSSEIACTLSHIKAILSLTDVQGEYFLICEDDIIFDDTYMFKHDLKHVIQKCPLFDVLLIYKTYINGVLNETYTKWNDLDIKPGGAVAYVISRQGIKKFSEYNKMYNSEIHTINPFSVADDYIYKNLNTYVYKYNYIVTSPLIQSTLHNHSDIHLLAERINNLDMQYKYFYEQDN
jgi:GT2 family glycosyltransferase/GR25 family glycosyltransferase involved in LPS biosynthesis